MVKAVKARFHKTEGIFSHRCHRHRHASRCFLGFSSFFKPQNSTFKVVRLISFARVRTGASALYFLVYEWIFLKENNDIDVGP